MGLRDWLKRFRGTKIDLSAMIGELAAEVFIMDLAVEACGNLLSGAISRSEFMTYESGKSVRKRNYYVLNVEANKNFPADRFWKKVIGKMITDNEALVFTEGGEYHVADGYNVKEFAFKDNIYTDVTVGDLQLRKVFTESDVLRFKLNNDNIGDVIKKMQTSYGKLFAMSRNHYIRNNARRGVLHIDAQYARTDEDRERLEDLLKNQFKRFFQAEGDSVMPFLRGEKYEELQSNIGSRSLSGSNDIRQFADDIMDFVAVAFKIPPLLLRGEFADSEKSVNNFITFAVGDLARVLENEINRKLYGRKLYLERTYCKIDTTRLKRVDLKDIAGSLDILLRIGAYCIDDCLEALGMEPFNESWSQKRYMTKNYDVIKTDE